MEVSEALRTIATASRQEIEAEIRRLDGEIASVRKRTKACIADLRADIRALRRFAGKTAAAAPEVPTKRPESGGTLVDRIAAYLTQNSPAGVALIATATGIKLNSVSSTLSQHGDRFVRSDRGWSLK